MASPIQWIWTWVNSGKGRGIPGMLQPMGLQRVRRDLVTEQQQRRVPFWLLTLSFNCDINWSFETDSVVYWMSTYWLMRPDCAHYFSSLLKLHGNLELAPHHRSRYMLQIKARLLPQATRSLNIYQHIIVNLYLSSIPRLRIIFIFISIWFLLKSSSIILTTYHWNFKAFYFLQYFFFRGILVFWFFRVVSPFFWTTLAFTRSNNFSVCCFDCIIDMEESNLGL